MLSGAFLMRTEHHKALESVTVILIPAFDIALKELIAARKHVGGH